MSIGKVLRYCLFKSTQLMVRESRIVASMFTKMCQERCWRSATKCSLGRSEQEANYTREQLHIFFSLENIILDMVADTRLIDGSV